MRIGVPEMRITLQNSAVICAYGGPAAQAAGYLQAIGLVAIP
jgi:rhodanese-related sulfurtransferase